ncbi:unnamed protein product [Adineta steineri]|uniref:Uncharacterized protein n=1 Tax=Adineta steineri TaxID=433720 RepID=A0A815NYZ0_9BILA|nr:unnamed protein product [Adineta steineri]CAF4174668.1 unnamed protein product [Adineta steineri]
MHSNPIVNRLPKIKFQYDRHRQNTQTKYNGVHLLHDRRVAPEKKSDDYDKVENVESIASASFRSPKSAIKSQTNVSVVHVPKSGKKQAIDGDIHQSKLPEKGSQDLNDSLNHEHIPISIIPTSPEDKIRRRISISPNSSETNETKMSTYDTDSVDTKIFSSKSAPNRLSSLKQRLTSSKIFYYLDNDNIESRYVRCNSEEKEKEHRPNRRRRRCFAACCPCCSPCCCLLLGLFLALLLAAIAALTAILILNKTNTITTTLTTTSRRFIHQQRVPVLQVPVQQVRVRQVQAHRLLLQQAQQAPVHQRHQHQQVVLLRQLRQPHQ